MAITAKEIAKIDGIRRLRNEQRQRQRCDQNQIRPFPHTTNLL